MSDPYKPNETAIEDALAKYRAGKVGLGGFASSLNPFPAIPPVRKPVDPQFRIDRLSLHIRRLELEIEATRIDLKEAMFEAGQLGPARVEGDKDKPDTAIVALEPAPETQAPVQPDPPSAELRSVPGAEENAGTNLDEPAEFISTLTGDPAIEPESGLHGEPEPTELDAEPTSVLDNPELLAAVERAEATLALALDAQTCEPIYPHPQPAYVGLQDPELDADWDAMKAREEKPKPLTETWHHKFGIFGKREDA